MTDTADIGELVRGLEALGDDPKAAGEQGGFVCARKAARALTALEAECQQSMRDIAYERKRAEKAEAKCAEQANEITGLRNSYWEERKARLALEARYAELEKDMEEWCATKDVEISASFDAGHYRAMSEHATPWKVRAEKAEAELAALRDRVEREPVVKALEPFMYGVRGPDGKAVFGEFCVHSDPDELRDAIDERTQEVVPLFLASPPAPVVTDEMVERGGEAARLFRRAPTQDAMGVRYFQQEARAILEAALASREAT